MALGIGRTLGAAAGALAGSAVFRSARKAMAPSLADKVVLITGGSRGLGLLLAREFAGAGCRICICARDRAELERAESDLRQQGAEVLAAVCDVADQVQVNNLVRQTIDHFGALDVLVNNAGIIQVGPLEKMTVEDFEHANEVIYLGAVYATMAALPHMRSRRAGRIVNITSIGGKVAVPHLLPYSAAKFALIGFSEGLRAELRRDGIQVTTVVPGLMRTGSAMNAWFKGQQELEYALFTASDATPLTSMDARRAAQRIVRATQRGEVEVVLSWQAKLLRLAHALSPTLTVEAMAALNRLLPTRGESEVTRGADLAGRSSATSRISKSIDRAARATNEYGAESPQP